MYYYNTEVTFEDGFVLEYLSDARVMFEELVKEHGDVVRVEFDGRELPKWFYEELGYNGLEELELYVNKNYVTDIEALIIYMEDRRYSDPEPWREFVEHYIGKYEDDEKFCEYLVRNRLEAAGIVLPDWVDDLMDYSRYYDKAVYWQQNGYYFFHN